MKTETDAEKFASLWKASGQRGDPPISHAARCATVAEFELDERRLEDARMDRPVTRYGNPQPRREGGR